MALVANSVVTPQTVNVAVAGVVLSTAMASTTNYDGTNALGTAMALIYTVGGANAVGGQLPKLRARYTSTPGLAASGTTNASVLRVWFSNGSGQGTAANNIFFGEVNIPAATMSQTGTVTTGQPSDLDFGNLVLPNGWKVYAGLATAMGGTNCGLAVSMPGGGDF